MAAERNMEVEFTPAELKFLASMKKLFRKRGSAFYDIQAQVYAAIENELAGPGESSVEAVKKTGTAVLMQKYKETLREATEDRRLTLHSFFHYPSEQTKKAYESADQRFKSINRAILEDAKHAYAHETEKLARKAGLKSETEITRAEDRFLKSVRKMLNERGEHQATTNQELYEALARELSGRGESTLEDITRVVEHALKRCPECSDAENLTVPTIAQMARKAGIKSEVKA